MRVLLFLSFTILVSCNQSGKNTSFNPGEIWADNNTVHINAHGGGMLFYNGKYYWFGEHKIEGEAGNRAQVGVHCYSSKDLYNWEDEGIALNVIEDDTTHDIAKGCILERPKVVYNANTNKFVMWFHLELRSTHYSSARAGIATSDNVTGPYTFVRSVRPNQKQMPLNTAEALKKPVDYSKVDSIYPGDWLPKHPDSMNLIGRDFEKGQMSRDMTIFVDDNGTAYHIHSSEENSTLHISELTDDYLDYTEKYVRIFINRYMEAPTIFKQKDKYYLIASGCTGWAPNAARSAVADNIFGPWEELGNPCVGKDSAITFHSQSTYVLPVQGKENAFIFMADRWNPENAIDGRYIWLPINFENNRIVLRWMDEWDLSYFDN